MSVGISCFNPRTHTGCDIKCFVYVVPLFGFNPRTHTGCDFFKHISAFIFKVSIHAPTRGATKAGIWQIGCRLVSIHAPTRGATSRGASPVQSQHCFNPRTHTGCDVALLKIFRCFVCVSIHAPTRGATQQAAQMRQNNVGFNPRTHTGCDRIDGVMREKMFVSIHAPTRGATLQYRFRPTTPQFQSTHPHGVRRYAEVCDYAIVCVSIHAPTRGATAQNLWYLLTEDQFQSTHPHGVRQNSIATKATTKRFNPRTHTGCDMY